MKRWAALDTTLAWGSVALVEAPVGAAPRVVAESGWQIDGSHAEHALPMLDALRERLGWPKDALDGFAVCRGPGSFTGARVGLGTVRGFSLAAGRPAIGIDRLAAMAAALGPQPAVRVPLVDAGRGEVYGAAYEPEIWPPKPLRAPWLGAAEDAIESPPGAKVFFGSGAEAARARLEAHGACVAAPRSLAGAVGLLAVERMLQGAPDGEGMSPLYLRRPDAELHPRTG